jgi:hypothetical protein
MKKAVLLAAALLACGALAVAQESTPATGATETNSASSANTVQGCLTGTSGAYMLTDANGTKYQLQGDESKMGENVNKEVQVTGTPGSQASASATNSPESNAPGNASAGEASGSNAGNSTSGTATGSTATASVAKTLSVTSIQKVADTCSSATSTTPQQ